MIHFATNREIRSETENLNLIYAMKGIANKKPSDYQNDSILYSTSFYITLFKRGHPVSAKINRHVRQNLSISGFHIRGPRLEPCGTP